MDTCSMDGCDGARYCRGWCTKHYQRWRTHGDPAGRDGFVYVPHAGLVGRGDAPASDMPVRAGYRRLRDWLLSRCSPGRNGCWEWQGALDAKGYGRANTAPYISAQASTLVHRAIYQCMVNDPVPGMPLDHLCRNPRCCNPEHLELVTPRENALRGIGPAAIAARATHCIAGHPFDAANTYVTKAGTRMCRACNARRQSETKARRRERSSNASDPGATLSA